MMDPIFFGEVPRCSYKCRTIVSDDFCYPTPAAEGILKNEVAEGLLVFLPKWAPLGPSQQRTMCLDEVLKLVYCWHEHSVYVDLAEKRRNVRDSWQQVKVTSLPSLTRMALQNKPLDIFIQHGPPEMLPKVWED